ncbi:MAG TPA: hypothetical protein VG860_20880 [Terriglobia bacterium]|jgi:hypothetical protein|nr:hypothetical protein [Terriglobia bacterium]
MSKIRFGTLVTTVLCAGIVIGLGTAYRYAGAQDQGSSRPMEAPGANSSPATLTPGALSLVATYLSASINNREVGPSYQPLDRPIIIACDNPRGCTIGVEQHVQVGLSTKSNNGWAICTQVDGKYIELPGCAWQGYLTDDAFYVVGSWAQQTNVSFGKHKVQTYIYSDNGIQEDDYSIIYRLYSPS